MGQQGLPPGFRFSPTDEELVMHYLKNFACGKDLHEGIITEVDLYKHEPWELPEKSALPSKDPVWYFFNAQDKKHYQTARINRTTSKGYWKATGKDRKICCSSHTVGTKKTLIYYEGRAPSGKRTDWIMHEYKLDEGFEKKVNTVCAATLCRVRKKGGPGPRNGEQFGGPVLHDNDEWENVEDEKLLQLSQFEEKGEVGSMKIPEEGYHIDEFPNLEGLDRDDELDLHAFLESFLADNVEATNSDHDELASFISKANVNPIYSDRDIDPGFDALPDLESLLELDGKDLHDLLHPSCVEEQILGEMLNLSDSGQCSISLCSQALIDTCNIEVSDDARVSHVGGDFIELNDMDSPLDGFVMRASGYHATQHEVEWVPDVLHTQGSATRRARLQISPPCVQTGGEVNDVNISILSEGLENGGKNSAESSSDCILDSNRISNALKSAAKSFVSKHVASYSIAKHEDCILDPNTITDALKSSTRSFVSKHVSSYSIVKHEEAPSQPFYAAVSNTQDDDCEANENIMHLAVLKNDSKVDTDTCKVTTPAPSGLPCMQPSTGYIQDASLDCEAGDAFTEIKLPKMALLRSYSWNGTKSELVSKATSLSLGTQLGKLEGSLNTKFNDKVFALGKSAAQLFPSKDYANPYNTLRRGVMASLLRLFVAVLFLFFFFLGLHILTKYALPSAA